MNPISTPRSGRHASTLLILAVLASLPGISAQEVHWVSSTDQHRWEMNSDLEMSIKAPAANIDVEVFPDKVLQRIVGFGGCFNELGWEALLSLANAERREILERLFSKEGANFTIGRVPVGASDYACSYYSYDDVPEDFAMDNFNIDRDRHILIPYIQAAQEVRPEIKFWASPWSPPAWMKVNGHYAMSPGPTNCPSARLSPGKKVPNNATAFKMETSYLEAYALYLSKYVRAYQKEGVTVAQLHVQNEVVYAPYWPSCTWRPEDLAFFIGQFLGPRFRQDDLKAEIWLGTINSPDPNYVRSVLKNKDAANYIKGIGLQWAGKKAIGALRGEYPDYPIMQTESECGNGEKDWKSAEYTWSLIHQYLSNGANAYMYWNMVLDSSGKSSWGWSQNTLISVNKETKEVLYTPEFYLMMHLSHFVLPGAHRILTSATKNNLAFLNPEGTLVLILVNGEDAPKTATVGVGGRQLKITMKPRAFNTLIWKP
jgi:glucosylceramidase